MATLFPQEGEARAFADTRAVLTWVGLSQDAFDAFENQLGSFNRLIRNVALLPGSMIATACSAARIPPAAPTTPGGTPQQGQRLTPIQVAQIGLVWRICRRIVSPDWSNFADTDPFAPAAVTVPPVAVAGGVGAAVAQVTTTKVQLKTILDQSDETEIQIAAESKVRNWAQNWVSFAHGPPLDEEDPTVEQLSALEHRVVVQDCPPYADFAVFTPYNRRISRANKFTAVIPQPDGSFLLKEVPGPQNHTVWKYCWRTFRCAAIQLTILREAAMTSYYQQIESLVLEWPDCWSLVYMADDKARSEGLLKKRRTIEASIALGQPAPQLWDPNSPWSACLMAMATDEVYWNRQVRNLAVAWLARGRKGAPQTREQLITEQAFTGGGSSTTAEAIATEVPAGATLVAGKPSPPGLGVSKSAVKRRRLLQELAQHQGKGNGGGKGKGKGNGGGKGKGNGGGKGGKDKSRANKGTNTQDAQGNQLCFAWNNGNGACGSLPPGSACPNGRTHACTICLSRAHAAKDHV